MRIALTAVAGATSLGSPECKVLAESTQSGHTRKYALRHSIHTMYAVMLLALCLKVGLREHTQSMQTFDIKKYIIINISCILRLQRWTKQLCTCRRSGQSSQIPSKEDTQANTLDVIAQT